MTITEQPTVSAAGAEFNSGLFGEGWTFSLNRSYEVFKKLKQKFHPVKMYWRHWSLYQDHVLCSLRIERNWRCSWKERPRFPSLALLLFTSRRMYRWQSARCNPTTPRHRRILFQVSLISSFFFKMQLRDFLTVSCCPTCSIIQHHKQMVPKQQ